MPCLLVALVAAAAPACGGGGEQITVFAASSLTDAFTVIEQEYEAAHPGVDIVVSFDGSAALAAQVEQGAPADVLATADLATMGRVAASSLRPPEVFARNRLTIVVEEGNPAGVIGLDDLARDDLTIVLAAPEVPVGNYAAQVLAAAGVEVEPASFEQNVRAVASKVALGEADAGIVYVTDVAAQPDRLDAVAIPSEWSDTVVADYPIAALDERGSSFVAFVLDGGRDALVAAGFEVP